MRQPVEDVEALYQKHVVSKMDSYDKSKTVIDINNITMTEEHFFKSFEPEGLLNSSAVDAQLSIWNAHYHDRIYLQQICAIFVPIFFKKHCFLVVANTETTSFDYMDSLSDPSYYEAALKVCENLRKYLCKHGIDALTWSLKIIPVVQQQNLHDCGYHMMLHMIHYGEKEMYNIVEVSKYYVLCFT
ncbi:hypothetical protein C2845_PM16G18810 [Panicum miliaceum]|uniref:Ubiquitin-like protease family profile domain-containing protein n=1 Tax=Panicum miliaceum TaxID=4540 RepID=A0A3L6PWD2_PANMI|nr:hypothetical protein C2845_PM16G18810 [Panicum miliaceum]